MTTKSGKSFVVSKRSLPHCVRPRHRAQFDLTHVLSTDTSPLSVPSITVARISFVFPLFQPSVVDTEVSEFMTLLPRTSCSVTFTSAWICAPLSCCQWQHHFPEILMCMTKELTVLSPPGMKSWWYPMWIESLSCLPSTFQHVSTSGGGFYESGRFVVHKKCFCALCFSHRAR